MHPCTAHAQLVGGVVDHPLVVVLRAVQAVAMDAFDRAGVVDIVADGT